jgi:hypothetical protein
MTPGCAILGSDMIHGSNAKIRWRSSETDSVHLLVLIIPVDFILISIWDRSHWKDNPCNEFKNTPIRCGMRPEH